MGGKRYEQNKRAKRREERLWKFIGTLPQGLESIPVKYTAQARVYMARLGTPAFSTRGRGA